MKPVYSFFLIIFFCLSQFNKSQAINLSDYSKEEQKQYKEITLKDIAAKAGVSQMTVSRTLRYPEKVNINTFSKVKKVIDKIGYVPNEIARSLATHRTNAVAIILPILNQVFAPSYDGL